MHNRFTEEFVAMDTKWYQLRYDKSSCFIALKPKCSVIYRATQRQHSYKASSLVNLNYGLEIHILGFCVLHVKWNSLNDIVHGNVIADFSGLDRSLVVSFDYIYFNRI